ncbi:hypothetical protein H4219_002938 [Mycoemilia scoparia]|uniref:Uncharacterized protein n=1 Tax=Mycoemilia scoparia TaxID=417184 RepID=A0A9W8A1Z0_9FUNG|nr:hypothetical protein H4219_002938 [Mycoemilia scoparia]
MTAKQLIDDLSIIFQSLNPNDMVAAAIKVHNLLGQVSLIDISRALVAMTYCWSPDAFVTLLKILVAEPPPDARGARPYPTSYFGEFYFKMMKEQLIGLTIADISTSQWIRNLGLALEGTIIQADHQIHYSRQPQNVNMMANSQQLAYGGMSKEASKALASLIVMVFQLLPCSTSSLYHLYRPDSSPYITSVNNNNSNNNSSSGGGGGIGKSQQQQQQQQSQLSVPNIPDHEHQRHGTMVSLYNNWLQAVFQFIKQYPQIIYHSAPTVIKSPEAGGFTWGLPSLHSVIATEILRNLLLRRIFFTQPTPIKTTPANSPKPPPRSNTASPSAAAVPGGQNQLQDSPGKTTSSPNTPNLIQEIHNLEKLSDSYESSILVMIMNGDPSSVYGMAVSCHQLLQVYYQLNKHLPESDALEILLRSGPIETNTGNRILLSLKWASGGLAPILGFNEKEFDGAMSMDELLAGLSQMKKESMELQLAHLDYIPRQANLHPRYLESLLIQAFCRLIDTDHIPQGKSLASILGALLRPHLANPGWFSLMTQILDTIAIYVDTFSVNPGLYQTTVFNNAGDSGAQSSDPGFGTSTGRTVTEELHRCLPEAIQIASQPLPPSQPGSPSSSSSSSAQKQQQLPQQQQSPKPGVGSGGIAVGSMSKSTQQYYQDNYSNLYKQRLWLCGVPSALSYISATTCTQFRSNFIRFLDEWLYRLLHRDTLLLRETLSSFLTDLYDNAKQLGNLALPILVASPDSTNSRDGNGNQVILNVSQANLSVIGACFTIFERLGMRQIPIIRNEALMFKDSWKSNILYFMKDVYTIGFAVCEIFDRDVGFLEEMMGKAQKERESNMVHRVGKRQLEWLSKVDEYIFDLPKNVLVITTAATSNITNNNSSISNNSNNNAKTAAATAATVTSASTFSSDRQYSIKSAFNSLKFTQLDEIAKRVGYPRWLSLSPQANQYGTINLKRIQDYMLMIETWTIDIPYYCQRLNTAIKVSKNGLPGAHSPFTLTDESNPLYLSSLFEEYKPITAMSSNEKNSETPLIVGEIQKASQNWIDQSAVQAYSVFKYNARQLLCKQYPSITKYLMDWVLVRYMCLDPVNGVDLVIGILTRDLITKNGRYNHRNSLFNAIRSLFFEKSKAPLTPLSSFSANSKPATTAATNAATVTGGGGGMVVDSKDQLIPVYTSIIGGRVVKEDDTQSALNNNTVEYPETCHRILLNLTVALLFGNDITSSDTSESSSSSFNVDRKQLLVSPNLNWLMDLLKLSPLRVVKRYMSAMLFERPFSSGISDPLFFNIDPKEWDSRILGLLEYWKDVSSQLYPGILPPIGAAFLEYISRYGTTMPTTAAIVGDLFSKTINSQPMIATATLRLFQNSIPSDGTHHELLKGLMNIPLSDPSNVDELMVHPFMQTLTLLKENCSSDIENRLPKDWFVIYFCPLLIGELASVGSKAKSVKDVSSLGRAIWNYLITDQCKHLKSLVLCCDGVQIDQGAPIFQTDSKSQQLLINQSSVVRLFLLFEQELPQTQKIFFDVITPLFSSTLSNPHLGGFSEILQDFVDVYTVCRSPYITNFVRGQFELAISRSIEDCKSKGGGIDGFLTKVVEDVLECIFCLTPMEPIGTNSAILDSSEESRTEHLIPLFLYLLEIIVDIPQIVNGENPNDKKHMPNGSQKTTAEDMSLWYTRYIKDCVVKTINEKMWMMANEIEISRHPPYRCPNPTMNKNANKLDTKIGASDDPFLANVGNVGAGPGGGGAVAAGGGVISQGQPAPSSTGSSSGLNHQPVSTYRRSDIVASRAATSLERSILLLFQLVSHSVDQNGNTVNDQITDSVAVFIYELARSRLLLDVLMTGVGKRMVFYDTLEPTIQLLKTLWNYGSKANISFQQINTDAGQPSSSRFCPTIERIWSSLDFYPLASRLELNKNFGLNFDLKTKDSASIFDNSSSGAGFLATTNPPPSSIQQPVPIFVSWFDLEWCETDFS